MKTKEIREKTTKELEKLLSDAKANVIKTRFQIASRETNKHQEIRKSKKVIAKILTITKEQELIAEDQAKEKK